MKLYLKIQIDAIAIRELFYSLLCQTKVEIFILCNMCKNRKNHNILEISAS